jgi:hypothetical protein
MSDQMEIRHDIGADGTLALRSLSGSVKLTGSDGSEAVVIARATGGGRLPELIVERGPHRLLVEPPRVGLSILRGNDVEIDFDITLPRGARIDLKSVSADVTGSDLVGEQNYKSVSGHLYLNSPAGRLTVQTVSGDIRLDGGRQLELNAMTTSGDVAVEAHLVDELRVRTVSGDVRVTGRLGEDRRHSVETVSGDLILRSAGGVTVEPARALDIGRNSRRSFVIGDGAAALSFRSMSGEERVTGPDTQSGKSPFPTTEPAATSAPPPWPPATAGTRLDVLRALERGEIDVEEAARRLEEVGVDA